MNETSVFGFPSTPCMLRSSRMWTGSLWQVINHCPQATLPEAACEQYPRKSLASSPPFTQPFNRMSFTLPPMPLPIRLGAVCTSFLFFSLSWKNSDSGSFWGSDLWPWAKIPHSCWERVPRFGRAGALKKALFLSMLMWSAVVWGSEPWGMGDCLFVTVGDLWWIGVWFTIHLSWVGDLRKGPFLFQGVLEGS